MTYKTQRRLIITLFLIIPLSLLIIFTYFPTIMVAIFSTLQWSGTDTPVFIVFDNYKAIFSDPNVFLPLFNSTYYFIGAIVQMIIALFFATILSFNVKFKNFFKGVLFFPYLINGIAVGLIFSFFFKENGVLNEILSWFGSNHSTDWMRTNILNNILLASVSVWKYMGFNMVMFIGAISAISKEIYEAAEMDGANKFQIFRYIILPSIKNIIFLNLILSIKGAVSVYELPYIMTGGEWGTSTFVIKTIQLGINGRYLQIGLASAMSFVLFAIIIIFTIIQRLIFKEKEEDKVGKRRVKNESIIIKEKNS